MRQQIRVYREWVGRDIPDLVEKRIYILNPWQLDPMKHIYQYALTKKEWGVYNFLLQNSEFEEAVWETGEARIGSLPDGLPLLSFSVRLPSHVRRPRGKKLPRLQTPWNRLPTEVQDYILAWSKNDATLRMQNKMLKDRIELAGDICNTWGQLHRIWPELLSHFPREILDRVDLQRGRSRLPLEFYEVEDKFTPAELRPLNRILAEAILLPRHRVSGIGWPNAHYDI